MIQSTMQRVPLSLNNLLERAGRLYPDTPRSRAASPTSPSSGTVSPPSTAVPVRSPPRSSPPA